MKIHFCDLCNESVPQSDLEGGHAFLRKGRVICATCDQLMGGGGSASLGEDGDTKLGAADRTAIAGAASETKGIGSDATVVGERRTGSPVPYRAEGSGSLVAGFLASVSLVLVAVVAVLLLDRVDAIGEGIDDRLLDLGDDMSRIEAGLGGRIDQVQESTVALAAGLDARLAQLRADREEAGRATLERIDGVAAELEVLRGRVTALTATERSVADHARALAAIDAGMESLRLDLGRLAEEVAARPVVAAPVLPEPAEPEGPVWLPLLEDLASANSGVRWNAVEELGEAGDVAVVEHLVPVLDDEDTFVRMAAARVLGDLGSQGAVGPLIDTLSDPAPSVRNAAVSSLRILTEQNFRFDPLAKEADRNKRIRAWRDWWEKQQETA